jgi:hypothetical protein
MKEKNFMWAVRILTGPQTGQVFSLQLGKNRVGRSAQCNVRVQSNGVSKEHCELNVFKDKIMVVDLKSSNGTFVNGTKVQNSLIRLGDKVAVHDIFFDIIPAPEARTSVPATQVSSQMQYPQTQQSPGGQTFNGQGYPAAQQFPGAHSTGHAAGAHSQGPDINQGVSVPNFNPQTPLEKLNDYVDRVAMPGIYKLAEYTDFKLLLGVFLGIFIVAVTALSMIPMAQITAASIEVESKRRALSIARRLASENQNAMAQGLDANLSTLTAENEEGVRYAFIISHNNGVVLAPASRTGSAPNFAFIHNARRDSKETVELVESSMIGAAVPIAFYSPDSGGFMVKAHAVVVYDMGTLAFDEGRALSLFIQTLVMALFVGFIIFFFMYKLIEYPFKALDESLDQSIREKTDNIKIPFQLAALQSLIGNLNTLLTRYISGNNGSDEMSGGQISREFEAENLVQMVGYAAATVHKDSYFIAVNGAFEALTGVVVANARGLAVSSVPDSALQQSLSDLIERSQQNVRGIEVNNLEFSGVPHSICCQAIMSSNGEIEYYVISFIPTEGGG